MENVSGKMPIQQYVAKQFAEQLGTAFEVVLDYRDKGGKIQDIAIFFNRAVVAFIECKRNAHDFVWRPRAKEWIDYLSQNEKAEFYFVADQNECFLYMVDGPAFNRLSFDDAVAVIKESFAGVGDAPTLEEIVNDLNELAKKHKIWKQVHLFIDGLRDGDIEYGKTSPAFSFSANVEDKFFLHLLGPLTNKKLCRYTTLNSLFELLKGKKQNMCNIVCMNDRGEYRYADEYVKGNNSPLGLIDFQDLDACFILSLLDGDQRDNLTMWRLYGDDANGTCVIYDAKKEILTGMDKQFFLANVSYGEPNGTHRKLDFVKSLLTALNKRGWYLVLRRWNIWKHFFKSYHFAVEKEVRLMYYDAPVARTSDKDFIWIKNPSSQIVSKMQLFDYAHFPLKIDSALVGPKCQEGDLLARQFSTMGKGTLPASFTVKTSKIKDYR